MRNRTEVIMFLVGFMYSSNVINGCYRNADVAIDHPIFDA